MQRKINHSLVFGVVVFLSIVGKAEVANASSPKTPPPLPATMISFGDSITAGAIAGLSRSAFYNPFYLFRMLTVLIQIAINWDVYADIQDRQYSWSTGLSSDFSVESHAQRLAYLHAKAGTQMRTGSVSWSGDTSYDLANQVDYTLEWSQNNTANGGPDYITLMIGANDVCADSVEGMTTDRDYYNNVNTAISRLVSANPKTKILISSLPDINSISPVAKKSRLMGFGPYARCEDVWRKTNLCYTLTRRPEGSLENELVNNKIANINRMLGEISQRINTQTKQQTVIYAPSIFKQKFTDDDISIDCFHPNQIGQNMIASTTWNESFWAKGWNENNYHSYVQNIIRERRRKSRNVASTMFGH